MSGNAQQINGREAKTATLLRLPAFKCFCPRHLNRYMLRGETKTLVKASRYL